MMTMRQFARQQNVSYEAIRAMVAGHKDALGDHSKVENRTNFLDDYAVNYLTAKRKESPVVIVNEGREEEIADLKRQIDQLKGQIAEIQEDRNRAQYKVNELMEEKNAALEERTKCQLVMKEYESMKDKYDDALMKATAAEARREVDQERIEELKADRERLQQERDDAMKETQSYKRTWFGLYRRVE